MAKNNGFKTDFTKTKVDKTGGNFAMSWTNNRPLSNTKTMVDNPGGYLSPMQLAGVGKKRSK